MSTAGYKPIHGLFVPGRSVKFLIPALGPPSTKIDGATSETSGAADHMCCETVINVVADMQDIQITDRAVTKIRQIASQEAVDLDSTMLRVAVIPGGCSGLTYDLGWDTTEQEGDRVFHLDGLRVVLDKRSYLYVSGSELDFSEGLEGKGFHFMNPQATRTCACGESFGL